MKLFWRIIIVFLMITTAILLTMVSYNIGYQVGIKNKGQWYQVTDTVKVWKFKPYKS